MVTIVPTIENEALFTIAQTCELLGIHRNTLREWTKAHKIAAKSRVCDGKLLYRGGDIKRIITTTI